MCKRMIRIAVTGGAGSGKTAVCGRLKARGVPVVSADELARAAAAPGGPARGRIVAHFGSGVLLANGALDRKALRRVILSDERQRKALEEIVHGDVIAGMRARMAAAENAGAPLMAAEVPLLFELGLHRDFDVTATVAADDAEKVERLVRRDGVSGSDAAALLKIQMPDREKIRRADYVIRNAGDMETLDAAVDDFLEKLAEKYGVRIESA